MQFLLIIANVLFFFFNLPALSLDHGVRLCCPDSAVVLGRLSGPMACGVLVP